VVDLKRAVFDLNLSHGGCPAHDINHNSMSRSQHPLTSSSYARSPDQYCKERKLLDLMAETQKLSVPPDKKSSPNRQRRVRNPKYLRFVAVYMFVTAHPSLQLRARYTFIV